MLLSSASTSKEQQPYYLRPYQRDKDDEIIKDMGYGFYVTRRRTSSSEFPLPSTWLRSSPKSKVSEPIKDNQLARSSKDPSVYQDTTWLECVTYSQLPKEETKMIDALTDSLLSYSTVDEEYVEQVRLTGGLDPGLLAISVGPAFQLTSLTISNKTNSPLSIHGDIFVPYSQNYNFSIFKRDKYDPLLLVSHQLSYLPLDDCPVVPVIAGRLKFSITNGVDDSQVFDGYCDVDDSIDDANEGKSTLRLIGRDDYCATMEFIKIPFAIIANVKVFLIYTPPSTSTSTSTRTRTSKSFKVHGKIIVNKIMCFDKKSEEEGVTIIPEEECSFFQSSRVIAVPVCSPLVVEVQLFRGGLKVLDDTLKVHPDSNARCGIPPSRILSFPCQKEGYSFVMQLSWSPYNEFFCFELKDVEVPSMGQTPAAAAAEFFHPLMQTDFSCDKLTDVEVPSMSQTPAAAAEVIELNPPLMQTDTFPWFKIHPEAGISEDEFWAGCVAQRTPRPVTSSDYVEVFSVFIGGGDDSSSPPALVGSVGVQDGDGTVYVFYRNAKCPDKLSNEQSRTLSLAWPTERCILEKSFYMYLKLQDDQGRVCQGSLCFAGSYGTRYGIRVCSVIPSKDYGYFAAVHYSIFKNGKRAKVSVEWEGEEDIVVYGNVVAQYSNYTYPSTYDKEYYRSIIFKRSKEDAVSVKKSSKIPLSKSNVSAPSDCKGLTIHVNLKYRLFNNYSNERDIIGNDLEFKAGEAKSEIFEGIKVKVEWPQNSSNGSNQ